jgi:hypothetical protein
MAFYKVSADRGAGLAHAVELICFALIVANATYIAASYYNGLWPDVTGVPSDFVNVWAAGKLALGGHATAAYDWPTHKLAEESAVGHSFDGYYGWHYPPTFLFAATALALLPYAAAHIVWALGTFPAYLMAIRAIIGERHGYFLAAAFPPVLANFITGQNGFLTAGLMGGSLILIDRQPILAGVLLGLLTYKPHLGLLFPIALAAGGYWRVFITAGIVAALMAIASLLAFGAESWQAFFANIGHTSQAFLSDGRADWSKLQTVFGLIRTLGGSEDVAWAAQAVLAIVAAALTAICWRSSAAFEIKAATLGTATLLATPYLYTYDLVALAVPLAFLISLGLQRGLLAHEGTGIGLICFLLLIFPFIKAPVGFAAIVGVAILIARRIFAERPQDAKAPRPSLRAS